MIEIDRQGPVWTLILQRPAQRNAVDRATAQALADGFRAFEADDTARAAVLWGAHGTFCAGADLKAFAHGDPNRLEAPRPDLPTQHPLQDAPMGPTRMLLNKPVIAAIAGHAVAGGLELALWCDLRIAEEDAVLGVFCRRFGVPLIDGGTVRLPRLIGLGRALDLILTGRPVSADEALSMGLVNRVVPPGQARAAAEELARQIADFPQICLQNDRLSAYEQGDLGLFDALGNEFRRGQMSLASEALHGARHFADGAGRHGAPLHKGQPCKDD